MLTPMECQTLVQWYKSHHQLRTIGDNTDYRAINRMHIHNPLIRDLFVKVDSQVIGEIRKETDQIVYPKMSSITEWPIGGIQPPHLDTYSRYELDERTSEEEKDRLAEHPSREWTLILFLNDDFKGGETYFPELKQEFTPVEGSGLLFQGIYLHHGVNKVRRGSRRTISTWFTTDFTNILHPVPVRDLEQDNLSIKQTTHS